MQMVFANFKRFGFSLVFFIFFSSIRANI